MLTSYMTKPNNKTDECT